MSNDIEDANNLANESNLPRKSLVVIIDDFTDAIFYYSNTSLNDFGYLTEKTHFDFYLNNDGSSDIIDLSTIVGASVSTATNSDGDFTLTVEDSQGQQQGTLTLEDVSIDDWNAMDQANILMFNMGILKTKL